MELYSTVFASLRTAGYRYSWVIGLVVLFFILEPCFFVVCWISYTKLTLLQIGLSSSYCFDIVEGWALTWI